MTKTINTHEAITHLLRLIEEAVNGDSFVIAKARKALLKVQAISDLNATGATRPGFPAR